MRAHLKVLEAAPIMYPILYGSVDGSLDSPDNHAADAHPGLLV